MSGSFQPSFLLLRIISFISGTVNANSMCAQFSLSSNSQYIPSGLKRMSAILWSCRSVILTPWTPMLKWSKRGSGGLYLVSSSRRASLTISARLLKPYVPINLSIEVTRSFGSFMVV